MGPWNRHSAGEHQFEYGRKSLAGYACGSRLWQEDEPIQVEGLELVEPFGDKSGALW